MLPIISIKKHAPILKTILQNYDDLLQMHTKIVTPVMIMITGVVALVIFNNLLHAPKVRNKQSYNIHTGSSLHDCF